MNRATPKGPGTGLFFVSSMGGAFVAFPMNGGDNFVMFFFYFFILLC